MKAIFNWRYYVLFALFFVGFLGIAAPFGEPSANIDICVWLIAVTISFAVGVGSFYGYFRCMKRWERDNKIPELINLTKLCDG